MSNESFRAGIEVIGGNVLDAVRSVMTCGPDYLVMGMSAVTFFGGARGADAFIRSVEEVSGLGISVGSHACTAALQAYGGVQADRRAVALLAGDERRGRALFRRHGLHRGARHRAAMPLLDRDRRGTALAAAATRIKALDGDDVDAIVQVGTNLSMVRLAAAAELFLGKPVIAINTATYWHALRANGIADRMAGFGRLLEEF